MEGLEVPTRIYSRINPSKFSARPVQNGLGLRKTLTADILPENMQPVIAMKNRVARITTRDQYIPPVNNIAIPSKILDSKNRRSGKSLKQKYSKVVKTHRPVQADIRPPERNCVRYDDGHNRNQHLESNLPQPTSDGLSSPSSPDSIRESGNQAASESEPIVNQLQRLVPSDVPPAKYLKRRLDDPDVHLSKKAKTGSKSRDQSILASKSIVALDGVKSKRKDVVTKAMVLSEVFNRKGADSDQLTITQKKTSHDPKKHFVVKTPNVQRPVQMNVKLSRKIDDHGRNNEATLPQAQDSKKNFSDEAIYAAELDQLFAPIQPGVIRGWKSSHPRLDRKSDVVLDGASNVKSKKKEEITNSVLSEERKERMMTIIPTSKGANLGDEQLTTLKKAYELLDSSIVVGTQNVQVPADVEPSSGDCKRMIDGHDRKSELLQPQQGVVLSESAIYAAELDRLFGSISPDDVRGTVSKTSHGPKNHFAVKKKVQRPVQTNVKLSRKIDDYGRNKKSILPLAQYSKKSLSDEAIYAAELDQLFAPIQPGAIRGSKSSHPRVDRKSDVVLHGASNVKSKKEEEVTKSVLSEERKEIMTILPTSKGANFGNEQLTTLKEAREPLDNSIHVVVGTQNLQADVGQSSGDCKMMIGDHDRESNTLQPQQGVVLSQEAIYAAELDRLFGPISPDDVRGSEPNNMDEGQFTSELVRLFGPISPDDIRESTVTNCVTQNFQEPVDIGIVNHVKQTCGGSHSTHPQQEYSGVKEAKLDRLFDPISPDAIREFSIPNNDLPASHTKDATMRKFKRPVRRNGGHGENPQSKQDYVRSSHLLTQGMPTLECKLGIGSGGKPSGEITKSVLLSNPFSWEFWNGVPSSAPYKSCLGHDRSKILEKTSRDSFDAEGSSSVGSGESHEWALKLVEIGLLEPLTESSPRFF